MARALPARAAVLDAEVIALRDDGRPRPFQETASRFGARRDVERLQGEIPLTSFAFDLLHLDGEDLLDAALDRRAPRPSTRSSRPPLRVPRVAAEDADAAARGVRRRARGRATRA